MMTLSIEVCTMTRAARNGRHDEVASQASAVLTFISSEEAAAHANLGSTPEADGLGLMRQPSLSAEFWSLWRQGAERTRDAAREAAAVGRVARSEASARLMVALAALRGSVDSAVHGVLLSPAGRSGASGPAGRAVLPRLALERVREDMDLLGGERAGEACRAVEDVFARGSLQGKLPWRDLTEALTSHEVARAGETEWRRMLCGAATPDWCISRSDVRMLLEGGAAAPCQPFSSVLRSLTRIRLVAGNHEPPMPVLFRRLDPGTVGFAPRTAFLETLRGVRCALSPAERAQLAVFFAPSADPDQVCYPHFLHSVLPLPADGVAPVVPNASLLPATVPAAASLMAGSAHMEALTRTAELESENLDLRERLRKVTSRCEESNALIAQSPAQAVLRLQGQISALETQLLERQTKQSASTQKANITLKGDLDVARHEVKVLQRQVEEKDAQLETYRRELAAILTELSALKDSRPGLVGYAPVGGS